MSFVTALTYLALSLATLFIVAVVLSLLHEKYAVTRTNPWKNREQAEWYYTKSCGIVSACLHPYVYQYDEDITRVITLRDKCLELECHLWASNITDNLTLMRRRRNIALLQGKPYAPAHLVAQHEKTLNLAQGYGTHHLQPAFEQLEQKFDPARLKQRGAPKAILVEAARRRHEAHTSYTFLKRMLALELP